MMDSTLTKSGITKRLIIYQLIGFGVLMFLIVGDEVLDFPHTVFGAPATPINRFEAFIEGVYVLVLSAFTAYLSLRLLTRVKYLEGFLPICAHCKKIRVDDAWTPLEEVISTHSAAELSHGLCPECSEKYYGDYLRGIKNPPST
jgi:hypothetical protein